MTDVAPYRRRVGAIRPSHLMFTSGVGSLVDLPNFSVLVRGTDDWRFDKLGEAPQMIAEPRLLAAVQRVLKTVKQLRPAPWIPGLDTDSDGDASRTGVPVTPFPSWMRCTACNLLAPIETRAFDFRNDKVRKPHEAKFFHQCRGSKQRLVVGARFVLSCAAGHLDDFPYREFVHRGQECPKVAKPNLLMEDYGGNIGANVRIVCQRCRQERNISEAMGRRGRDRLPRCRGRHPHLGTFDPQGCDRQPHLLVAGASNLWFAQTLSALAVPEAGANALDAKVEQFWENLELVAGPNFLPFMRSLPPLSHAFEKWPDDEEVWAAIERHRARLDGASAVAEGHPDLLTPEWRVFSGPTLPEASPDFTLRRDPDGVPAPLKDFYADVVQAERLREVRAMIGFTRLDAPDFEDPELVTRAPLSRSKPTWVPASEVRGEGIFLRVPEEALAEWEARVGDSEVMRRHREAYGRFREHRYSDRLPLGFDKYRGWPGPRYYALHTLSHLLIRTIALECGYNSASLSERIYSSTGEDDEPRGGILIYTAVPDAEGTLGGLVSLGEPDELVRLTRRALADARHCSSDPLCAERLPRAPEDFLHGAACHVCLFVSETTCERGNRFLDRRLVVPVDDIASALYPELP